jgi:hypothetical protein|tara:strand:- start:174 stop:395 length:222 start_codon:yes stop_codon:yes gene_type:complete
MKIPPREVQEEILGLSKEIKKENPIGLFTGEFLKSLKKASIRHLRERYTLSYRDAKNIWDEIVEMAKKKKVQK